MALDRNKPTNKVEFFYIDHNKTLQFFEKEFSEIPEDPFISISSYALIVNARSRGSNIFVKSELKPYEELFMDEYNFLDLNIPLNAFRQPNELIELDFADFYTPDPSEEPEDDEHPAPGDEEEDK